MEWECVRQYTALHASEAQLESSPFVFMASRVHVEFVKIFDASVAAQQVVVNAARTA